MKAAALGIDSAVLGVMPKGTQLLRVLALAIAVQVAACGGEEGGDDDLLPATQVRECFADATDSDVIGEQSAESLVEEAGGSSQKEVADFFLIEGELSGTVLVYEQAPTDEAVAIDSEIGRRSIGLPPYAPAVSRGNVLVVALPEFDRDAVQSPDELGDVIAESDLLSECLDGDPELLPAPDSASA